MTDGDRHREQARGNREHAEAILSVWPRETVALQWVVTAAFYCAVHCIEAHLATLHLDSTSHEDRSRLVADPNVGVPDEVVRAYDWLKNKSMGARYFMHTFDEHYVRRNVLDGKLKRVTDWIQL